MSAEVDNKILQHEKECRDGSMKDLRNLCELNARTIAEINARLKAGNDRFAAMDDREDSQDEREDSQDERISAIDEEVRRNAVTLAKVVGIVAAGGAFGAGLSKFIS